ncbi:RNA helicase [Bertholletia excelsa]
MAQLPINLFEEKILETVERNPVTVIIGETGSGKSTQLSQMLHKRGYTKSGIIAVTQPRRVAAVSVSRRVAQELGVQLGEEVGYAIRFEDRTSERTCIKYLTDGVLLRESLSNPELSQYSIIILDEAHERSLNTDILLGLMKRLIKMRASNLNVLITSATLDGEKVEVIPVEIFYSKERPKNYLESSLKTAIDIHIREPEGDVLIFMTGQDDIEKLVKKLEERVQNLEEGSCMDAIILPLHGSLPPELQENRECIFHDTSMNHPGASFTYTLLTVLTILSGGKLCDHLLSRDSRYLQKFLLTLASFYSLIFARLFHSLFQCLDASSFCFCNGFQVRVFSPPPPNCRRFIVATNIAETSLTVDGVVYVIDSGYVKQRQYNPSTGMYSLDVVQISRVQADQRAGRAGRTCPGKCYRLYPSIIYHEEFLDATVPEIQRSSLAGSVLYLKSLDLPDIDILKFDFLDPPSSESLEDALKQLYLIDAIDENGSITSIGRTMAELPLEPSLSRTLLEANEMGCLAQALTVAAMLSVETTLLPGRSKSSDKKRKHDPSNLPDGSGWGDHLQLLQIYELWDRTDYDIDWCKENNLQVRGMKFVRDVRKQLSQIMQKIAKGSLDVQANHTRKGSQEEYKNLRKALCVGYAAQLAERMIRHNGYRTIGFRPQLVQVHPSSVLSTDDEGLLPNYVVYHELISTTRPFMRNVCAVEMPWVMPILQKLEKLNIRKLSGGSGLSEELAAEDKSSVADKDVDVARRPDDHESRIQAARERFLARKAKR